MIARKVKQGKKEKERFNSIFLPYFKEGRKLTRKDLMEISKWSDSACRREISLISMFYPIISFSSKQGYEMVDIQKLIKNGNIEEIDNALDDIDHTINEHMSRILTLKKKIKPLIANKKVLEKEKQRLCQELSKNNLD